MTNADLIVQEEIRPRGSIALIEGLITVRERLMRQVRDGPPEHKQDCIECANSVAENLRSMGVEFVDFTPKGFNRTVMFTDWTNRDVWTGPKAPRE